jgi:hypothetical protein
MTTLQALIEQAQTPRIDTNLRGVSFPVYDSCSATISGVLVTVRVVEQCRRSTSRKPADSLRFKADGKVISKADLLKLLSV